MRPKASLRSGPADAAETKPPSSGIPRHHPDTLDDIPEYALEIVVSGVLVVSDREHMIALWAAVLLANPPLALQQWDVIFNHLIATLSAPQPLIGQPHGEQPGEDLEAVGIALRERHQVLVAHGELSSCAKHAEQIALVFARRCLLISSLL